jgi:DNA-binding CsgD family transcriptional regulator
VLHGRERELDRLDRLLDGARSGRAGALVLLGEPGLGKSALLDEVSDRSAGFRLLATQGLESEAPLAFAALHRLLRPVQDLIALLPAPQAHALRVAFGVDSGSPVEPFLVAVATLSILAEAAERAPVLCLVDDAHWLDAASRDALLFTARRLTHEPVAVVLTARSDADAGFHPIGLDTAVLSGLDTAAASSVLSGRSPSPLSPSVVAALVARTGGNPLALVELPSTLTTGQLAGADPLPDRLPLTQAVERSFLDRVRRLSQAGQSAMLIAAADDSGRLRVVRDAAVTVGAGGQALVEAERAGLVATSGDRVQVVHPLVRSATYQAATGNERRAAHRALAAALADVADTDRRAWHLAAAVDGPDFDAADALRRVAVRAEVRGGHGAAAAAFDRAAALSQDGEVRARLLFDAARNLWLSGDADGAGRALATARQLTEGRVLRADIDRLRGRLEVNVGSAAVAQRILVEAARAVAADDPERAVEMAVAAGLLRIYDPEAAHDPTSLTPALNPPADGDGLRMRTLRRLLDAQTADAAGRLTDALGSLADAVETDVDLLSDQRPDDPSLWTGCAGCEPDIVANLGNTAIHLGHDDIAHDCYHRVLADGRRTGAITVVLYALPRLAFTQLLRGQWDQVRHAAHEAIDLATSVGQPALTAAPQAWLALLAALQGDPTFDEQRQRAATSGQQPLGVLAQLVRDLQHWADATAAANAGDHGGAQHGYTAMRVPALRRMTAVERITATARAGEAQQAGLDLDELTGYADATQLPWALAACEHARAVLAPADRAVEHYERSLVHHRRSSRAVDRARTQLAYGELLRRSQRRTDARAHLRTALAAFEDLAAEPLAGRARAELRASGETARKRDPSTRVALTPMETQVARLVAQGMSNKDVAAQLWISPRTVAFHLRGVFAKHGIVSRGELAQLRL